jgi:hypothetical protein
MNAWVNSEVRWHASRCRPAGICGEAMRAVLPHNPKDDVDNGGSLNRYASLTEHPLPAILPSRLKPA